MYGQCLGLGFSVPRFNTRAWVLRLGLLSGVLDTGSTKVPIRVIIKVLLNLEERGFLQGLLNGY